MMLTKEEAVSFVKDVLNVPGIQDAFIKDKLAALNSLLYPFQKIAPFQNITLLSAPVYISTTPTPGEVHADIMARQGGMCFTLNYFMGQLLEALGYDVSWADCPVTGTSGYHVAVIVNNVLKTGDR